MRPHRTAWIGVGVAGLLGVTGSFAQPGAEQTAERGRVLYAQYCAVCHGPEGQGRVEGNATSLNNPDFLALASDTFLHTTMAQGRRGTAMRGWGKWLTVL